MSDLVNNLDEFKEDIIDEANAGKITQRKKNKIIKAVDKLESYIEEIGY